MPTASNHLGQQNNIQEQKKHGEIHHIGKTDSRDCSERGFVCFYTFFIWLFICLLFFCFTHNGLAAHYTLHAARCFTFFFTVVGTRKRDGKETQLLWPADRQTGLPAAHREPPFERLATTPTRTSEGLMRAIPPAAGGQGTISRESPSMSTSKHKNNIAPQKIRKETKIWLTKHNNI